ncbi:transposase, partial [Streptomyces sp. NPDC017966]|uniref:transposase n=1 Tax=Streptomyces sp. NPDC017966 TaxID=3365023 RepID=UPI0037A7D31D
PDQHPWTGGFRPAATPSGDSRTTQILTNRPLKAVAQKLGIGTTETLRKWVRQDQIDAGTRPGTTTEESAKLKRLKKENAELKRANEILKAAASFFAAELDRPHTRS